MPALTITNAGAEAGDTSGWVLVNGDDFSAGGATYGVSPNSGSNHFIANNARTPCEMYQNLDVSAYAAAIDAGGVPVDVSWYHSGNPSRGSQEAAYVLLSYRNASDTEIGTYISYSYGGNSGYAQRQFTDTVPANTRTIRLRVQAFDNVSGDGTEVLADDFAVSLDTAAELSATLVGTGGMVASLSTTINFPFTLPISNADAESGSIAPWLDDGDTAAPYQWTARTSQTGDLGTVNPHAGTYLFGPGNIDRDVEMYQDVSVADIATEIDVGNVYLDLSWQEASARNNNRLYVYAECRDSAGGTVLGTINNGTPAILTATWREGTISGAIPTGTRSVRLRFRAYDDDNDDQLGVALDAIAATATVVDGQLSATLAGSSSMVANLTAGTDIRVLIAIDGQFSLAVVEDTPGGTELGRTQYPTIIGTAANGAEPIEVSVDNAIVEDWGVAGAGTFAMQAATGDGWVEGDYTTATPTGPSTYDLTGVTLSAAASAGAWVDTSQPWRQVELTYQAGLSGTTQTVYVTLDGGTPIEVNFTL